MGKTLFIVGLFLLGTRGVGASEKEKPIYAKALGQQSIAKVLSGGDFLELYKRDQLFFVRGAFNVFKENDAYSPLVRCIPPTVTLADAATALIEYLAQKPDKKRYSAASSLVPALAQKFCGIKL